MAFVLIQHLDPVHKSLLPELVQRFTSLPVLEVTEGVVVQPDCIYIIPPGQEMTIAGRVLHLADQRPSEGLRLPINIFLESLAEDQQMNSVAVILSGTGSDGTLGLGAIRKNGGFVLAQDKGSAEYGGMPDSAADTGKVDARMPPEKMISAIVAHFRRKKRTSKVSAPPLADLDPDSLKYIFTLLKTQTNHDFSQYKPTTIRRRIERRMEVHRVRTLADYKGVLDQDPQEVAALFNDLLIGVTSFFRDPEVFEFLGEQVIPKLLVDLPHGAGLRIWSAGCSTGEESYSLAIVLQESLRTLKLNCGVQVFATDIDNRAITQARAGVFPSSIASDVTEDRLQEFFVPSPDLKHVKIKKTTRDLVVFSEHDVLKDPPFFKLDLLVCRNLLIYFSLELQKKLIPIFHYALNPGGILVLGTSETVGEFGHLFQPLDRERKIYRRLGASSGRFRLESSPIRSHPVFARSFVTPVEKVPPPMPTSLQVLTEELILSALDMAAVLVNAQGDALYFHGRTGYFLEPAPGVATTQNILKMAKDGLKHPIATALHQAAVKNEVIRGREVRVAWKDVVTVVQVSVHPLKKPSPLAAPPLFLVLLEERPLPSSPSLSKELTENTRLEQLAEELKVQEEYLQSSTEQMESSNEELRSSNEELQSLNEELQSTNEELDTSKEELQSVNEELSTVNSELNSKVSILATTVNDMNNLLSATGVATVFVDLHLNILRFTPEATRIINLVPGDVGRPVGHLTSNLVNYQNLENDAQGVLDTLVWFEVEVMTRQDSWYRLRIQPYRTVDNVIEGAVISFGDITEIVRQRQLLQAKNELLRMVSVVQDSQDPIIVQDLTGKILAWNPTATKLYGWSEEEALGMNFRDHIPAERQEEALQKIRRLVSSEALETYRTQRLTKDGRILEVSVTSSALLTKEEKIYAISTIERVKGTKLEE